MKGVWDDYELPVAEEIHLTTLSLPVSFYHSEEAIDCTRYECILK
jgi:hypothetical protein